MSSPSRRPIGRGHSPQHEAALLDFKKALALQQLMRARCFDDEDRRLVHEHVLAAASRASASVEDETSILLAERRALLSVASAQGLLPTDSQIFHAMLEKQLQLQK